MVYFTVTCIIFGILAIVALALTDGNISNNEAGPAAFSMFTFILFVMMFFWSAHTGCNVMPKPNLPAEVQTKE